eukprot:361939-Chlamydomonas_euryale.AAC.8
MPDLWSHHTEGPASSMSQWHDKHAPWPDAAARLCVSGERCLWEHLWEGRPAEGPAAPRCPCTYSRRMNMHVHVSGDMVPASKPGRDNCLPYLTLLRSCHSCIHCRSAALHLELCNVINDVLAQDLVL